eukprot:364494-Chlamydomonas_euryale.AAC.11
MSERVHAQPGAAGDPSSGGRAESHTVGHATTAWHATGHPCLPAGGKPRSVPGHACPCKL